MKYAQVTVPWAAGLHLRPAAKLAQLTRNFRSEIRLRIDSHITDARSVLGIVLLSASLGAILDVEVSGADEHEAIEAVQQFFADLEAEGGGGGGGGGLGSRVEG